MRTFLIAVLTLGRASWAADVSVGKAVYAKHCQSCHGANGAAPANVAKFQEGRMVDLRSQRVQSMSAADLSKVITAGKGKMRADTSVSAADIENIAAYIHELKG